MSIALPGYMQDSSHSSTGNSSFTQKVLIAAGLISLFAIVLLVLWKAFHVVLLVLAGILIASWFRGVSYWLADKTSLSEGWSLAAVVAGTFIIITLIAWLLGAKVQSQASQLQQQLPTSVHAVKQKLSQYEWGQKLVNKAESMQQDPKARQKVVSKVKKFFKGMLGILGDIYVILFIAVFFTATPSLYVNGFLRLIPPAKRDRGREVINRLGRTLRSWLVGKIFAMIVVAILTYIALLIIGLPFTLVLAVIAGLLNFIPNFGPLIAMVPAALLGFTQSTQTGFIVIAVYAGIQVLESNFITPLIQKRLIQIPPALIIIAQILMGVLTGALGVILATPFVALIMVLVKSLYSEPMEERS